MLGTNILAGDKLANRNKGFSEGTSTVRESKTSGAGILREVRKATGEVSQQTRKVRSLSYMRSQPAFRRIPQAENLQSVEGETQEQVMPRETERFSQGGIQEPGKYSGLERGKQNILPSSSTKIIGDYRPENIRSSYRRKLQKQFPQKPRGYNSIKSFDPSQSSWSGEESQRYTLGKSERSEHPRSDDDVRVEFVVVVM